ncbi:MAG TPA: hypothetical protein VFN67_33240 [Polyangiales bacterium]|nr:hypothetical protein [Polyangiales bacterium]
MSAVRQGTQFALCAGFGLILIACGSSAPEEGTANAGNGAPLVDNFPNGSAGQSSGNGFKSWQRDAAGSGGSADQSPAAAGSGGAAGQAGVAAGSGGASGSAGIAAAGTGGAGGAAGSGEPSEPDPFDIFGEGSAGASGDDPLDLFGQGGAPAAADSCTDVLCLEHAECQATEHAACRFTRCENFICM